MVSGGERRVNSGALTPPASAFTGVGLFRFTLRRVLFDLFPNLAFVAWILSWPLPDDPTPSDPSIMPWLKLSMICAFLAAEFSLRTLLRRWAVGRAVAQSTHEV